MSEPREVERRLRGLRVTPMPEPEALWREIRARLAGSEPRRTSATLRRPVRSPWVAAAAVVFAVVAGGTAGLYRQFAAPARWAVVPLAGTPALDGARLREAGDLTAGAWLVTDASSRARLQVGRIGTADVGPGSRVRLERGGLTAHRLTLDRGSLRAVIDAPPRLFLVATPSALATDLGCAYTLEVDSAGASRLHVTAGWVELEQGGAVSLVPAGLVAEVEKGRPPGTPYPEDFSDEARAALRRLDAGRGSDADVETVLGVMTSPADPVTLRQQSGITLWHLLQRVEGRRRERVLERLTGLAPPPRGVTREGILALDRQMLDRWRRDLNPMWSEEGETWWGRLGRRVWTLVIR